jgi:hypothetical protein
MPQFEILRKMTVQAHRKMHCKHVGNLKASRGFTRGMSGLTLSVELPVDLCLKDAITHPERNTFHHTENDKESKKNPQCGGRWFAK